MKTKNTHLHLRRFCVYPSRYFDTESDRRTLVNLKKKPLKVIPKKLINIKAIKKNIE